jgi:1-acyl-sn-glycerol-3-phosphate acyltransferase
VAKVEMLRYPLLPIWMKNIHCTFLDRKDLKQGMKTILENINLLKQGISVCVFPEGTRNRTDEVLLPFRDGSFKMAEKSGCPIVPMTLNNTGAIFEDHIPKIKKAHVVIEYSKPIYMNELSKEEKRSIGSHVSSIIINNYEKNKELV